MKRSIYVMISRLLGAIYWGWLMLLMVGCSSDESFSDLSLTNLSVPIDVQLQTLALDGQDQWVAYPGNSLVGEQHATRVRIYVFQGTGPEAEYVGYAEEVGWKAYFGTQLPHHTASMPHRLRYGGFLPGVTYTFLGVALNEEAFQAFDFPLISPGGTQLGTTLAEARAQLKNTSQSEAIRRSEIYVGTTTYAVSSAATTKLTLYRRVAGVRGYFTQVPRQIMPPLPAGVTDGQVSHLRITLYTAQNASLPLLRRSQQPSFADYLDSPHLGAASQVLVEIPVPATVVSGEVLTGGSYVLPVPAPVQRDLYTLRIELVNRQGQLLAVKRAKLSPGDVLDHGETGGGTGIIDAESAFRFPIIANHYYAIGSPTQPISLANGF